MHEFIELEDRCTTFTFKNLKGANKEVIKALQKSNSTSLLKALEMIQLQKAFLAVGIFSMFEADLQVRLDCDNINYAHIPRGVVMISMEKALL